SGTYTLIATSSCRAQSSDPAVLTVTSRPVITMDPANASVCAGQPASFSVATSGPGPVTYQWQKGNPSPFSNIDPAANPTATQPTLMIGSTTDSDAAYYRC